MQNTSPQFPRRARAFTLVEILVVIAIIGLLAALSLVGIQKVKERAAETKSLATMRSVLQANAQFAADNNGQIATVRWDTENKIVGNNKYVSNSFWGALQPYLFPGIKVTAQKEIKDQILANLITLFGSPELSKMTGTPFAGAKIYMDGAGLPVPFAFNNYLHEYNEWVRQQQVYSLPSSIYITYGHGLFDEVDAQTYAPMAKAGETVNNNIYYLPSKRAIAGFMDGRVEFLTPPIAEKMVKIDGSAQ